MSEHDMAEPDALRFLQMVGELHKLGFERIRITPGLSPSGIFWRCSITHSQNVQEDGWQPIDYDNDTENYGIGQGDEYFRWPDAPGKTPPELAAMFIERFMEIAAKGKGSDPSYVSWFNGMLERAEQGHLPVFFADYPLEHKPGELPPPPQ